MSISINKKNESLKSIMMLLDILNIKNLSLLFLLLFISGKAVNAQNMDMYEKHLFIHGNDTMPYRLLLPLNFNPKKKYPFVLFLHGAGERGKDNESQLIHGAKIFLTDSIRKNFPAIVVFPQCAKDSYWSNVKKQFDSVLNRATFQFQSDGEPTTAMKQLVALYKYLEQKYPLEKSRQYVGGLSMGGMGTFEIVRRMPDTFAAAFAICGGADTSTAAKIKQTAWWIFHGLKDNVVNAQFSIEMSNAVKNQGTEAKLTLFPEAGHNSWDDAFKEPEFFPWLFSHKK